jgi:hypothetical protein
VQGNGPVQKQNPPCQIRVSVEYNFELSDFSHGSFDGSNLPIKSAVLVGFHVTAEGCNCQ